MLQAVTISYQLRRKSASHPIQVTSGRRIITGGKGYRLLKAVLGLIVLSFSGIDAAQVVVGLSLISSLTKSHERLFIFSASAQRHSQIIVDQRLPVPLTQCPTKNLYCSLGLSGHEMGNPEIVGHHPVTRHHGLRC